MNDLFKYPNVVLIGKGHKIVGGLDTNVEAVVVGVSKKLPLSALKLQDIIPPFFEGLLTDVVNVGEIRALGTDKMRPAKGGCSIGHKDITAGTFGMTVKKKGVRCILSNAHVLADTNEGKIGDAILQPGKHDGGTLADTIGYLYETVPINMTTSECPVAKVIVLILNGVAKLLGRQTRLKTVSQAINRVDCALAVPIEDSDISDEIIDIGVPVGFAEAYVGMAVKKSGRTTDLTHGAVLMTEVETMVNYGSGTAFFEDQIAFPAMSEPGDSGSVILSDYNEAISLLFAGSDQITIGNRIQNVRTALGLD